MKRLFFLLAFLSSMAAFGAGTTATVSWTPPTSYVDGSALPAGDIASYTITWTGGPGSPITVNAPATSATVPVPCGNRTFTVAVTTKSTALYPSATSGPSNQASYASGVSCVPNPPTGATAS